MQHVFQTQEFRHFGDRAGALSGIFLIHFADKFSDARRAFYLLLTFKCKIGLHLIDRCILFAQSSSRYRLRLKPASVKNSGIFVALITCQGNPLAKV